MSAEGDGSRRISLALEIFLRNTQRFPALFSELHLWTGLWTAMQYVYTYCTRQNHFTTQLFLLYYSFIAHHTLCTVNTALNVILTPKDFML